MHEFSVVQSLLNTIEKYADEQKAREVTKIFLRVGPLSGIVPHLLKTAFDTFKEGTVAGKAELILRDACLKLTCLECREISESGSILFRCPACGSLDVRAEDGDDLILETIEMEC